MGLRVTQLIDVHGIDERYQAINVTLGPSSNLSTCTKSDKKLLYTRTKVQSHIDNA